MPVDTRPSGWKHFLTMGAVVIAMTAPGRSQAQVQDADAINFQTHALWSPRLNIEAGTAIVYGIDATLPQRVESWRSHGYHVALMTGVSWGEYSDYLDGRFDGKQHWDEAQMDRDGKMVLHGSNPRIPYIAPSASYGKFLAAGVLRALDAGVEAVFLEEPEFWAKSGWSESFKREWQAFYGTPWQAPDSSPDAQYRASKLKYFLYRRALADVFAAVKQYGQTHHKKIPCYVATHSLVNYAQWRIVSPESSLIDVGADGYIAQVWTGTARTPNALEGKVQERTFEAAFLEYGAMQNLVRASGRKVWYLNDPIEDNPNHTWEDYRFNWESTLTASLFQPEVSNYEVVPWPERIFGPRGIYPSEADPGKRVPIAAAYESELQTVFHALGQMKKSAGHAQWLAAGSQGIGVLVSDTLMFQRTAPSASDERLSSFFGLSLPLLAHGIPVEPVQIESFHQAKIADRYRCLLLTYEGQKPPSIAFHHALVHWVKAGGVLVVIDDGKDPYQSVSDWWNTAPRHYARPMDELFEELGIANTQTGVVGVGEGIVLHEAASPAALAMQANGSQHLLSNIKTALAAKSMRLEESDRLILRRGPYIIAKGLSEAATPSAGRTSGYYLDLFSANMDVLHTYEPKGKAHLFLLDVAAVNAAAPTVIASAGRISNEHDERKLLTFSADGIEGSTAIVRIKAASAITGVRVNGMTLDATAFGSDGITAWLRFPQHASPQTVEVHFQ
ncbi:hypothetical protein [Terriglobus albidus]|uniref:hypothetical protein n=1 Tax=Terriglobus albidus TaxID=1592106 RepID=UPI0021E07A46|nr:hypothetical protein [Terriglobus albidus]